MSMITDQRSCTAEISLVRAEQGNISPGFAYTSRITSRGGKDPETLL